MNGKPRRGATVTEVLAGLVAFAFLASMLWPMLGGMARGDPLAQSMSNLRVLGQAMTCYAGDWNGRQFTAVPDDLGAFGGNCEAYATARGCFPPLHLGVGCEGGFWAFYLPCNAFAFGGGSFGPCSNVVITTPLTFAGRLPGSYRLVNARAMHTYVNGRFYDPVFYAPADSTSYPDASAFFDEPCEYVAHAAGAQLVASSYVYSPAAMFHPDVFRAKSAGGFQAPETLDHGFQSPSIDQARFPALKTRLIEHRWLQDPPGPCNPDLPDLFRPRGSCNGYLFNHGLNSRPAALFFDGHVAQMSMAQAVADDNAVLQSTGGVDGLWSRDTPLGKAGYYGLVSVDGTIASPHILTTGGILGRDILGR